MFILAAFHGENEMFSQPERAGLADLDIDDKVCEPSKLCIIPATVAANCGICSKLCKCSYHIGPPQNMYDMVQEIGRYDRGRGLKAGGNGYKIHLPFPTFARCMFVLCNNPLKKNGNVN